MKIHILTLPSGMYTASKAALNAFSETLRLEMMPLGVGVVLIKIGTIATKHHTGGPSPVLPEGSYYTSILDYITRWATGVAGPERGSVQDFVNDIVHDVVGERKTKTGIVWRGAHSGACWFATRFLPTYIVVSCTPCILLPVDLLIKFPCRTSSSQRTTELRS